MDIPNALFMHSFAVELQELYGYQAGQDLSVPNLAPLEIFLREEKQGKTWLDLRLLSGWLRKGVTNIRMIRASFRCEDMVKCIFGLSSLSIEICEILLLHSPLTAEGLREIVKRNKSTVHHSLQSLMACGITYRRKIY